MSVKTEIFRTVELEDPNLSVPVNFSSSAKNSSQSKSKPLRIPVSEIRAVKLNCSTASSIPSCSSSSFDLHSHRKSNLISPIPSAVFEIDSRDYSGMKNSACDGMNKDKMITQMEVPNEPRSTATATATTLSSNTIENDNSINNNLFNTFREGTSSGFSSDLDNDSDSASDSNSDIDSDTSDEPPLLWNFADFFAAQPGNDWCVRVPESFIQDEFNLFELADVFHCPLRLTDLPPIPGKAYTEEYTFDDLLEFITIEDLIDDPVNQIDKNMLEDSILLYKLIHQRYILTKAGLQEMCERFEHHAFGTCPRYLCHDHSLLPIGLSDLPNKGNVRVYCPNCQDIYVPSSQRHAKMDGVVFGTTFSHFLIRTFLYPNSQKACEERNSPRAWQQFVPKIYGFRIYRDPNLVEETPKIRSERPTDYK